MDQPSPGAYLIDLDDSYFTAADVPKKYREGRVIKNEPVFVPQPAVLDAPVADPPKTSDSTDDDHEETLDLLSTLASTSAIVIESKSARATASAFPSTERTLDTHIEASPDAAEVLYSASPSYTTSTLRLGEESSTTTSYRSSINLTQAGMSEYVDWPRVSTARNTHVSSSASRAAPTNAAPPRPPRPLPHQLPPPPSPSPSPTRPPVPARSIHRKKSKAKRSKQANHFDNTTPIPERHGFQFGDMQPEGMPASIDVAGREHGMFLGEPQGDAKQKNLNVQGGVNDQEEVGVHPAYESRAKQITRPTLTIQAPITVYSQEPTELRASKTTRPTLTIQTPVTIFSEEPTDDETFEEEGVHAEAAGTLFVWFGAWIDAWAESLVYL